MFLKIITLSTRLLYSMGVGYSDPWVVLVTLNAYGIKGHLGVLRGHWPLGKNFLVTVSTYFDVFFYGTWMQWSMGMQPQQKWDQRSVLGQWPLVKFVKNSRCIHIPWFITMGVGHNDPWVELHVRHHLLDKIYFNLRLLLTFMSCDLLL